MPKGWAVQCHLEQNYLTKSIHLDYFFPLVIDALLCRGLWAIDYELYYEEHKHYNIKKGKQGSCSRGRSARLRRSSQKWLNLHKNASSENAAVSLDDPREN